MNIILLLKYLFLGFIQGFTEPLPISSSGHLVLFQELLSLSIEDLNFEIIVNLGSLFAIVFLFRHDLWRLIKHDILFLKTRRDEYKQDFIYSFLLVLAVIPAGIVGLLLKDWIEDTFKNVLSVGLSLLVTAIALYFVQKESTENTKEVISTKDAITIGLFQVFSLLPGISRSGSTMVGGLSRKIKFEDVMRFSFLLYIPISLATMVLAVRDIDTSTVFITGYLGAFLVSIVTTYFAVLWFFRLVRKGNLKYFAYYCLVVGFLAIGYVFIVEVI
uniref:Undecaprenyl-diphosphatase n=1 Tax=Firmicutes bacterium enrichment culture clone fosmid MGS-M1 TaxID=1549348 RepID=A0A0B5KGX3_9FIRM|nr:undecaprenyl-diphosphatase 2 [Firmicutes bacterium enrichment culture clone fosmid MGS-M1]